MTASKRICLIYTGGTLGMVPSDRGYVPSETLDRLLAEKAPDLGAGPMPDYDLVQYRPPIDSANATPRLWYNLAERIVDLEPDYDGFVIIHGTDTLAYTASALSFLLAALDKPVIVTGAQIPLYRARNDAYGNLLSALLIAALAKSAEVSVCFGRRLLRGNRTTKVRSTALDAFESPNCPPLADLGTEIVFRDPPRFGAMRDADRLSRPAYRETDIVVLPVVPGLSADLVRAAMAAEAQALVLECYGTGNAPDGDAALLRTLRELTDAGIVVVAVSQCLEGSVRLGTYASSQALAEAGALSGHDMTREAVFTKLHYLFACGLPLADIRRRVEEDLRGELSASAPAPARRNLADTEAG